MGRPAVAAECVGRPGHTAFTTPEGYSVVMAKVKTFPWDVVDYLETDEDQVLYLEAVLEGVRELGDPERAAAGLVDIARARGLLDELEAALRRCKEKQLRLRTEAAVTTP